MNDDIKNIVKKAILLGTISIGVLIAVIASLKENIIELEIFKDMKTDFTSFILFILIVMMFFMTFCYVYISILILEYNKEKKIAKTAIDSSGLYHIKLKTSGALSWYNDNFANNMKCTKKELINENLSNFTGCTKEQLIQLLNNGGSFGLNIYNNECLNYITWSIIKKPVKARENWELLGLDITDIVDRDMRLLKIDYYDELTGLYNFKKFILEASLLIRKEREYEFTMINLSIDRFQELINLRGTSGCDQIQKVISEALIHITKFYSGSLITRTGVGKFSVLVKGGINESTIMYREIINTINDYLKKNNFGEEILFSNGAAIYPKNATSIENVYEKADLTLKNYKYSSLNQLVFYDKDIMKIILDKRLLESRLLRAFEKEEFQLYYQPKIDLNTMEVVGREALIRWISPEEGIIPPGQFIPLAEEIGLVKDIDDWGLREACMQTALFHKNNIGPRIGVSVNICAEEFYNGDIVNRIKEALEVSGLEAKYLDIELTESMTMINIKEVTKKIKSLKALGVTISLDDFGTGYSSFSYLKILPIDIVKLDKSFIDDIAHDKKSRSIVGAIITLANSLGIDTLAEGVEHQEQSDILLQLGCKQAQGYLYGRAVPSSEITKKYIKDSN